MTKSIPDGRFRVHLDNDHHVLAHTAGKMRRYRIRSVVDDRVKVEMTAYALDKGRMIFREKAGGPAGSGPRRHADSTTENYIAP